MILWKITEKHALKKDTLSGKRKFDSCATFRCRLSSFCSSMFVRSSYNFWLSSWTQKRICRRSAVGGPTVDWRLTCCYRGNVRTV